jgi:hypothetical protein
MMSIFNGGDDVGAYQGGGRGRAVVRNSSFSLGWSAEQDPTPVAAARGGKRMGNLADMPSKAAYAMALQEQIAERNAHRAINLQAPSSKPSMPGVPISSSGTRDASPFARFGAAVVDPSSKAAMYAEDLRAQIDAKAVTKAEERRRRIAAEREENMRMQTDPAQVDAAKKRASEEQSERHRLIAERGDALERFMVHRGDGAPQSAVRDFEPAGMKKGADPQQRRGMPPRGESSFRLGW